MTKVLKKSKIKEILLKVEWFEDKISQFKLLVTQKELGCSTVIKDLYYNSYGCKKKCYYNGKEITEEQEKSFTVILEIIKGATPEMFHQTLQNIYYNLGDKNIYLYGQQYEMDEYGHLTYFHDTVDID